jgi:hypothetical protein
MAKNWQQNMNETVNLRVGSKAGGAPGSKRGSNYLNRGRAKRVLIEITPGKPEQAALLTPGCCRECDRSIDRITGTTKTYDGIRYIEPHRLASGWSIYRCECGADIDKSWHRPGSNGR